MDDNARRQIEDLIKRFDQIDSSLNSAQKILRKLEDEYLKVDYSQIEGEVGKFDGTNMVTDDGKEYLVQPNYAAKSKLVYGDVLKLIDEDGKKLFKQIERVSRERVEGILTKKDGEWYLLTDRGSYKVSDAAAEYQKAELNSEATAFLPQDNLDAPFATLDTVESPPDVVEKKPKTTPDKKKKKKPAKSSAKKEEDLKSLKSKEMDLKEDDKKERKTKSPSKKKTATKTKTKTTKTTSKSKASRSKKPAPKKRAQPKSSQKKTEDKSSDESKSERIIEDDDLI